LSASELAEVRRALLLESHEGLAEGYLSEIALDIRVARAAIVERIAHWQPRGISFRHIK
jgi:hypothetical protein